MCEAFALSGHQIELIVPWRLNHLKEDVFKYYGIEKSFEIKKIPSVDLIGLPFGFWIQSISFSFFVFFYLLFRKADIIYSRNPLVLSFLGLFKKNIVYEIHAVPRNFFVYKWIFKKAKAIVVITQGIKDSFIKRGIDNDKILIAPDGVDLEQFNIEESQKECRQKLGLPLDNKLVIYTGQLFKWKGAYTLAEASKFLDDSFRIILVGGMKKDIIELEKFVQKEKLDKVIILGHQMPDSIPFYLKSADVLVLPNSAKSIISRKWTSPMKMFEYMTSQRPIIASDLPALREILNQNNAFLARPDDAKDLANNINQSLRSSDFSAKISKQAFEDVKKYTWTKRSKKILYFLKNG